MSHEAPRTGGFAAEVAADMQVQQQCNSKFRASLCGTGTRCFFVVVFLLSRCLFGVMVVAVCVGALVLARRANGRRIVL